VGETVSRTVTVSLVDAVFPDVSVARAVRVCVPGARAPMETLALQLVVPEASCETPPSTESSTRATARLSAAEPVTVTVPESAEPGAGAEIDTVGGVRSDDGFGGFAAAGAATTRATRARSGTWRFIEISFRAALGQTPCDVPPRLIGASLGPADPSFAANPV
jgi:hypothetical protein